MNTTSKRICGNFDSCARSAAASAAGASALALIRRSAACWLQRPAMCISDSASMASFKTMSPARHGRLRLRRARPSARPPASRNGRSREPMPRSYHFPHCIKRYPSRRAYCRLQFGVAFLVESNRHCRPLYGILPDLAAQVFQFPIDSFATSEMRAVMRCWMVLNACG